MIDLYIASTNQLVGNITEADLQVLVDGLEEESSQDRDYYITAATIDLLADGRATTHLVGLLRRALGSSDGVDIRWQRREPFQLWAFPICLCRVITRPPIFSPSKWHGKCFAR